MPGRAVVIVAMAAFALPARRLSYFPNRQLSQTEMDGVPPYMAQERRDEAGGPPLIL